MPTVDLNLGPNYGPAGGNPLDSASTIVDMQSKFLQQQSARQQIQLFGQQLAARARFGQIVASSPDLESGLAAAAKDPQVAPYAGEWIGQYRNSLLADQQFQNERQRGATEGVGAVKSAIGAGVGDPSLIPSAVKATLEGLSPYAKGRAAAAAGDLTSALTANLPADPDKARAVVRQRAVALSGATPDQVKGILGVPGTQDVGSGVVSGVTAPPQGSPGAAPGAFVPSSGLTKGVAPTIEAAAGGKPYVQPGVAGGLPMQLGGGGGGVLAAPGAGTSPPNPFGPMPVNPFPEAGHSAPPPAPAQQIIGPSKELAGDGKPLFADVGKIAKTPFSPLNQGTNLNPAQAKINDGVIDQYTHEIIPAAQRAQAGMAQAAEVDSDLDQLHKAGGWQTPGSFGNLRNSLAKMVATYEQATGQKSDIDPSSVSSYEQLNKDTTRMGQALASANLGEGHLAAQTISSTTAAVPSVDNTYLGAKLVNASIKAQFQYAQDMATYVSKVQDENHGDIRSAIADFASEHPAKDYAEGVLKQFGLVATPKGVGFADAKSLKNAYDSGLVTQEEAKAIAAEQFGYKGKK